MGVRSMGSEVRLKLEFWFSSYKLLTTTQRISVVLWEPLPLTGVVRIKCEYTGSDKHSAWHLVSIQSCYFNFYCYYHFYCNYYP